MPIILKDQEVRNISSEMSHGNDSLSLKRLWSHFTQGLGLKCCVLLLKALGIWWNDVTYHDHVFWQVLCRGNIKWLSGQWNNDRDLGVSEWVFTSPSQPMWCSANGIPAMRHLLCVTGRKLARNNTDEDKKFNFSTERVQFDLSSFSDPLVFNSMSDSMSESLAGWMSYASS